MRPCPTHFGAVRAAWLLIGGTLCLQLSASPSVHSAEVGDTENYTEPWVGIYSNNSAISGFGGLHWEYVPYDELLSLWPDESLGVCWYVYSNVTVCKVADFGHWDYRGADCAMVSAQEAGLEVDSACEIGEKSEDANQMLNLSSVEEFNKQVCRNLGEYVTVVEAQMADLEGIKSDINGSTGFRFTFFDVEDMISSNLLKGAWNDTGVAMIDTRPHQCQCLAQRLPYRLDSRTVHVPENEAALHLPDGTSIQLQGEFLNPPYRPLHETRSQPLPHHLDVWDYISIASNMLTLLSVAHSMSNYHEVKALWQMQRHALVHYYGFNVEVDSAAVWWPVALGRKVGWLYSPPVKNGQVVKPVVAGRSEKVPTFSYFKNFMVWRAYTAPKQLNVHLALLVAELVLALGVLGFLLPMTGLTDSLLDPILRPRQEVNVWSEQKIKAGGSDFDIAKPPPGAHLLYYLAIVSLSVNCAAVVAILLFWTLMSYWRHRVASNFAGPQRSRVANFLFLWVANAAGAAELLLVNSFLGPPSATALNSEGEEDAFARQQMTIAYVYACMVVAYAAYVVLLSVLTINIVPLRMTEDVFLLGLTVFACYTVVLDASYEKEGQFLVTDEAGAVQSCKTRFLDYFPLDDLCRGVVATCAKDAQDIFSFGEEPGTRLGRYLTYAVILLFKAGMLWYERRMDLR